MKEEESQGTRGRGREGGKGAQPGGNPVDWGWVRGFSELSPKPSATRVELEPDTMD